MVLRAKKKFTVTKDQLACNVGSGLVSVFATPMMIAAIENTAAGSVAGELEEGKTTVGTLVKRKPRCRYAGGHRKSALRPS
mgnify:CR=1 FL=1